MVYITQAMEFLKQEPLSKLISSIIIIGMFWLVKKFLARIIDKEVVNAGHRYTWQKTISYTLTIITILIVGRIWFAGFQSIATFLGLLSAGLAIALKDLIANLAGWLFIIWRKPFEVGDRIQLGDKAGDVIDLRPFQFTILEIGNWVEADQSTGRIIHIPNNLIFTQPLCNYNSEFVYIWNEIPVLITFESDWVKAKEILLTIANEKSPAITEEVEKQIRKAARRFLIIFHKITPAVYTNVKDSGVLLTIRYLVDAKERRGSSETIWEAILTEFGKNDDINLAYSTLRVMSESNKTQ